MSDDPRPHRPDSPNLEDFLKDLADWYERHGGEPGKGREDDTPLAHSRNYVLDGHEPIKMPDLRFWAQWFETADRVVKRTEVGNSIVSTVFLGIDHNWGDGPPVLFETMVIRDGEFESFQRRYCTWEEAENGHEATVILRSMGEPLE